MNALWLIIMCLGFFILGILVAISGIIIFTVCVERKGIIKEKNDHVYEFDWAKLFDENDNSDQD